MRLLVFGTFDHLHPGHLFFLGEASKLGELHVVIARDINVERIKGKTPSQNESDRLKAVHNAFPDAHVILGDCNDFLSPIRSIKPDCILLGYDQKLPPGVSEKDLPRHIERLAAFEPERWKSSLKRTSQDHD